LIYPSGLAFFGLTPQYRSNLFTQIHEITFHGQGGYDWHTVYNMPIWLRRFTFKLIEKHYKEQNEAIEKSSKSKNTMEITRPAIEPKQSYTTKATKNS
jgi:hypothetical protein